VGTDRKAARISIMLRRGSSAAPWAARAPARR
jgi:hypothetical protein